LYLYFNIETCLYLTGFKLKNMSSYNSLDARVTELTRQLNQKDIELG